MPAGDVAGSRTGRAVNVKKKRRPFMAASGISTDHLLRNTSMHSFKLSLCTSDVVSCGISLCGFLSSYYYRP